MTKLKYLLQRRKFYKDNRKRILAEQKRYNLLHPEIHLLASRRYAAKKRKNRTQESLMKTATWIGRRAELDAINILRIEKDMNNYKMNFRGYDLIWNGQRIDVKSKTIFSKHGRYDQWSFHSTGKDNSSCDAYLCMCYSKDWILQKMYLIPKDKYPKTGITVGVHKSKWDTFLISFQDKIS